MADYERNGKRSLSTGAILPQAAEGVFKSDKLVEITRPRIDEYQTERLKAGMARATVNREVRYLRRGFQAACRGRPVRCHSEGGSAQG